MVLLKFSALPEAIGTKISSTFHYGSIKIQQYLKPTGAYYRSTFHYGSIKIATKLKNIEEKEKSTFHYGSIKISLKLIILELFLNLHSTMVLLKCIFTAFCV